MNKKTNFYHFVILAFCVITAVAVTSCNTSRNNNKRSTSYSRNKTKQLRWNSSTSPTTTYYIKKHSTKKRQ